MVTKKLIWGSFVLLIGVLIMTGCPDPVNTETPPNNTTTDETKPLGTTGTDLKVSDFKSKLTDTAKYEVPSGGLTVDTSDTFTVPATKKLKFTGDLTLPAGSIIIFKSKDSVEGSGKIKGSAAPGVTIIGPSDLSAIKGDNATFVPLHTGATLPTGDYIGVDGNLTISAAATAAATATAAANIKNVDLTATKNLYVIGTLTVSADVSAASITVLGSTNSTPNGIEATATISAALDVAGAVSSTKAITITGASKIGGKLELKGTGTDGNLTANGALTVGGTASITGTLTDSATSANTITFNGTAATIGAYTTKATASATTFAGSAPLTITTLTDIASASTVTFNGTSGTTITGAVTTNTDGLTIAGTGAVTLSAKPVVATSKLLSITNTGGVTLSDGIEIAVAGGLTVSESSAKIILPNGKKIGITSSGTALFGKTAKVTLGGEGDWTATKALTITATATTGVDITGTESGAELASSGNSPEITLAANTALAIGGTVTLKLGGTANGIAFTDATSTVVLKSGAKITGTADTTFKAKSGGTSDGSAIKLTATDGTNSKMTFVADTGTVTASSSNPSADVSIVVGKSSWASGSGDNTSGVTSTVAGTAAVGSITAGTSTTVTLAGSST